MYDTTRRGLLQHARLQEKKVRHWRIVAGLLLLVAVYGLMGRMDRDAAHESIAAQNAPQHQAAIVRNSLKGEL